MRLLERTLRTPRCVLLGILPGLLSLSCGAATHETSGSPVSGAVDEETETTDPDQPSAESAPPATCDATCQSRIDAAAKLLAQAEALKGAERAQLALYGRAADAHIKAWRGCHLVLPDGEDLGCEGSQEVVLGLVRSSVGTKQPAGLVFAYLVALDDRWRDDSSELAAEAPGALRRAAEDAAEQARSNPKGEQAAAALAAAVYGYLALDEVTEATRHAATHAKLFARSEPYSVSLVAAAVAAYYNDREQFSEALAALSGSTNPARVKHPRVKVLWHCERGRALSGLGREPEALREFGAVVKAWRPPDPKDPSKVIGRQEPLPMLGRERVVDAVGAAYFHLGEQQRAKADKLDAPRYRGPQTPDGVERFIQGSLARWAQRRQKLVAAADAKFKKIYGLRPVPPARWVVAAAAHSGKMWESFAEAMVSIELPPKLAADADTKAAFERALQGSAKPARDAAEHAFHNCADHARQSGLDDENAAECQSRLKDR